MRKALSMQQKFMMLRILGQETAGDAVKFLFWVHDLKHADNAMAFLLKRGYCGKELVPFLRHEFAGIDFERDHLAGREAVRQYFARLQNSDSFFILEPAQS